MRRKASLFQLAVFIGAMLFPSGAAIACICSEMFTPPCAAFQRADVVFIGTVDKIIKQGMADDVHLPHSFAYFKAVKFFKGNPAGDVAVGFAESDCDFKLEVNKQYLVYAYLGSSGKMELRRCDRTRLLEDAEPDLTYIKSLASDRPQIFVTGAITSLREDELRNIRVIVTGKRGSTENIIDRVFFNVGVEEPGDYTVRLMFPFKIKVAAQAGINVPNSSETTVEYAVNVQNGRCGYREINFVERLR